MRYAITSIAWIAISGGALLFLCALILFAWELPRLVRAIRIGVECRRFWRHHSNYVPDYWERQVRR